MSCGNLKIDAWGLVLVLANMVVGLFLGSLFYGKEKLHIVGYIILGGI